jgi:hypothetical protein
VSCVDKHESRLRPRAEIEAARAAALDWMPDAYDPWFERGAIAAFDWLLGHCGETPASGVVAAPTPDQVLREEHLADDATYGRPGAPELWRTFAVGVANALMWARGVPGVDPPVDFDISAIN